MLQLGVGDAAVGRHVVGWPLVGMGAHRLRGGPWLLPVWALVRLEASSALWVGISVHVVG
jgi:hypothetical protein